MQHSDIAFSAIVCYNIDTVEKGGFSMATRGTVKDKRRRKCKATPKGSQFCDNFLCRGGKCPMRYKERELRHENKRKENGNE